MTAKLPEGWKIVEEEQKPENQLPPGWKVVKETTEKPPEFRDVVSEELRGKGYEPDFSEELERASQLGIGEGVRGLISGVSFGLSENVPGLKTGENVAANTGRVVGSLAPISKLFNAFGAGAAKLASKSPIFQKQLTALGHLVGVPFAGGAAVEALEHLTQGELPKAEDLLDKGAEWAALDVGLNALGASGRFVKGLLRRGKQTGKGQYAALNEVMNTLKQEGVELSTPETVGAKALEVLERQVAEGEAAGQARKLELVPEKPSQLQGKVHEAAANVKPEPITPKALKGRQISDEPINRLTSESLVLAEPYQPEGLNFTREAEALEKDALGSRIENAGSRAGSQEELGISIREDIESNLERLKEEYRPLYEQAEKAAHEITHIPRSTGREAAEKLTQISKVKTRPEGYSTVIRSLETALEDAGFVIKRNEAGIIENIVPGKPVSVQKTMELARRLNEIVDYEAVEPTVKNVLKKVARAAKQDIRVALKENPDALAAFELAEQAHATAAKKFGRDSVRRMRGTQAGERVAKMAESPNALGDLREVLSPKQMQQVEREILEKLNAQSHEAAQKSLREVERHLSAENRKLARDIVDAKNPHNPHVRKRIMQNAVLDDMSNALTNGTRPERTLKLWKTPKGQALVKETFHNSPNWPAVKNYLEKQSFNDMVSSVLSKEGTLDVKKLKDFMKDPGTVNNIRAMGGEGAVTFFRGLESNVRQLEHNAKLLTKLPTKSEITNGKHLLEKAAERAKQKPKAYEVGQGTLKPTEKIDKEALAAKRVRGEKILERMSRKDYPEIAKINDWKEFIRETLGLDAQGALTVFGVAKLLGAYSFGIPRAVAFLVGEKMLYRMLTSRRVRDAFAEATKKHSNPFAFIVAMDEFSDSLKEQSQEQ